MKKNTIGINTTLIGKFNGYLKFLEVAGNLIIKDQSQVKIGNLIVLKDAVVDLKKLVAEHVYIDGTFKGDIQAEKRVILEKNSNLIGNIQTPEIITREGAIFYGNLFLTQSITNVDTIQKKIEGKVTQIKNDNVFKKNSH